MNQFLLQRPVIQTYIATLMGVHQRYSFHVANYNCMEVPVTGDQSSTSETLSELIVVVVVFDYIESLV